METVNMSEAELDAIMEHALSVIRQCGDVIKNSIAGEKTVSQKESRVDLVTETDKAVEKLFVEGIKSKYPDHRFIGEESTAEMGKFSQFDNAPTWIVDPIDGTMNFVHSFPLVCISVALAVNRRIEIGVVHVPVLDQLFVARKGKGATMNGKAIKVSDCKDLSEALFIFELWASVAEPHMSVQVQNLEKVLRSTHAVRCPGSAAINLAFVACGQADAYHQFGIHCWDIAAGALLVKEAGGVVVDTDGGDFDFMSRRIVVAANDKLAKEIVDLKLQEVAMERDYADVCPM